MGGGDELVVREKHNTARGLRLSDKKYSAIATRQRPMSR